jgi:fatty acid desaturase
MTGLKFSFGRVLMDLDLMKWTVANDQIWLDRSNKHLVDYAKSLVKNSSGAIATNAALYGVLKAFGQQRFYWLWPLAYLTPFPLFLRIRSMAEHAGMQTSLTALTNTRTTRAGWIARSFVAPIHVNYHMEHHLMASVPYFKLPRMHGLLRERGHVPTPPSYFEVIESLSSKPERTA